MHYDDKNAGECPTQGALVAEAPAYRICFGNSFNSSARNIVESLPGLNNSIAFSPVVEDSFIAHYLVECLPASINSNACSIVDCLPGCSISNACLTEIEDSVLHDKTPRVLSQSGDGEPRVLSQSGSSLHDSKERAQGNNLNALDSKLLHSCSHSAFLKAIFFRMCSAFL